MGDFEETIRKRAYALWERAGRPEGRSEEFWHAARADIDCDGANQPEPFDPFEPPIDEPPVVAFQHGVPVGMPGERIAEQGVEDDRLAELFSVPRRSPDD